MPSRIYRNRILQSLSDADIAALTPHLRSISLPARTSLASPDQPIERVYFPEGGLISVVTVAEGMGALQTGLVGVEGMTGLAVLMGDDRSAEETCMLVAGSAHWVDADRMADLLLERPTMHRAMLRFANAYYCQVAQTAVANGAARIDVRLARFLLMAADRLEGGDMPLTHEMIAKLLSVRRPGITDSFHRLEGERVIRSRRGVVVIRDRAGLEAMARGAYGIAEREYQRCCENNASPPNEAPPRMSRQDPREELIKLNASPDDVRLRKRVAVGLDGNGRQGAAA